jgi:hypothetical protein
VDVAVEVGDAIGVAVAVLLPAAIAIAVSVSCAHNAHAGPGPAGLFFVHPAAITIIKKTVTVKRKIFLFMLHLRVLFILVYFLSGFQSTSQHYFLTNQKI